MIMSRGLLAAAVAAGLLCAAAPAVAEPIPGPGWGHPDGPVSLRQALAELPVAAESRAGYKRSSFRHWIDEDGDGCSTRAEVLIAEARTAPQVGPGCTITGGTWFSYYDNATVTNARSLDIDHMVPLAEAFDSGASQWPAERRRAYANDLGAERSLVAVTAKSNRSKADRDPAQWWVPSGDASCTYLADWTATKRRWGLTIDPAERDALLERAAGCPNIDLDVDVLHWA
jgi:hypothetical protein